MKLVNNVATLKMAARFNETCKYCNELKNGETL
jgi:hypothetical protein